MVREILGVDLSGDQKDMILGIRVCYCSCNCDGALDGGYAATYMNSVGTTARG